MKPHVVVHLTVHVIYFEATLLDTVGVRRLMCMVMWFVLVTFSTYALSVIPSVQEQSEITRSHVWCEESLAKLKNPMFDHDILDQM